MNAKTRCTAVFLLMISTSYSAAVAETLVVTIGTEAAYPPFNNLDASGNFVGFEIELMNEVCKQADMACTWVAQDWDGLIPALLASKFDAAIGMSITDERLKQVDFSNPYQRNLYSMIGLKDTEAKDADPQGLESGIIGMQAGTAFVPFVEERYPQLSVQLYPNQSAIDSDILAGRIDYVLGDTILMRSFVAGDGKDCCRILGDVPAPIEVFGAGVGVAIRKDNTEVRDRFNAGIETVLKNGFYADLSNKYFDINLCPDCETK
jgi:polar amino acid transport system substrate-binding protein